MAIDKTEKKAGYLDHLPRRGFYAPLGAKPAAPVTTISRPVTTKPDVTTKARAPAASVLVALANALVESPPKHRGRPLAAKPWEAAGISRMTWHRRQKAAKESK